MKRVKFHKVFVSEVLFNSEALKEEVYESGNSSLG